jgi:hypothetical protein
VFRPAERVTVQQMIDSFTIKGAKANFLEKETGSIEVGKSADMIALSRNILTCKPMEIGKTKVLLTVFRATRSSRTPASSSRTVGVLFTGAGLCRPPSTYGQVRTAAADSGHHGLLSAPRPLPRAVVLGDDRPLGQAPSGQRRVAWLSSLRPRPLDRRDSDGRGLGDPGQIRGRRQRLRGRHPG